MTYEDDKQAPIWNPFAPVTEQATAAIQPFRVSFPQGTRAEKEADTRRGSPYAYDMHMRPRNDYRAEIKEPAIPFWN